MRHHEETENMSIQQFLASLKRMQQQMKHIFYLLSKEESLSQALLFLLMRLHDVEALKITEISEHFSITAGAATGMTDKLEDMGYVMRLRSEEDRRIVQVVLTDEGRKKVQSIKSKMANVMTDIFRNVPQDRICEMSNVLDEIADILQTYTEKGE